MKMFLIHTFSYLFMLQVVGGFLHVLEEAGYKVSSKWVSVGDIQWRGWRV